jgi:predicted DCC family thiol-disulfide oxidoreductase YuxK
MKQTIVFYDNNCPICIGVTGWLSRIDHQKQFLLEPYQNSDILKKYPQIIPADCEKQIHIINEKDKVLRGADAMFEIWRKTDHWSRYIPLLLQLPPFIWLARPIYRLIAKNRKSIYS